MAALIQIAQEANPPLHLFLGQDAYDMAYVKLNAVAESLENWKSVTLSTAYAAEHPTDH